MQRKRIDVNNGVMWLFIFIVGLFLIFPAQTIVIFFLAFIAFFIWQQTKEQPYKYNNE